MSWLEAVVLMLLACFALVVFVGPPYVPTLASQVKTALDMLDLKPGQTMLELGCGDGKVLVAAARRGWHVVGIELNPLLVLLCRLRTWRYRRQVRVVWGNYWNLRHWPPAQGIFGFVLPRYMGKLDTAVAAWLKDTKSVKDAMGLKDGRAGGAKSVSGRPAPVKLASFAFAIPDKPVVREERGVFLYEY